MMVFNVEMVILLFYQLFKSNVIYITIWFPSIDAGTGKTEGKQFRKSSKMVLEWH